MTLKITVDTNAIDSMKAKMLVQIPGTKMLHLPTFDTKRGKVEDTMDHLVNALHVRTLYQFTNILLDMLCTWHAGDGIQAAE